jgi:hypothetical protein
VTESVQQEAKQPFALLNYFIGKRSNQGKAEFAALLN